MNLWILDGHNPVQVMDVHVWSDWFKVIENRCVARDVVEVDGQSVEVSTVFLGLDHGCGGSGPPLLFETMVFGVGHDLDQECQRYVTWEEAVTSHAAMLSQVKKGSKSNGD